MGLGSVGPYDIIEKIGRGGMGEVFLARDPRLHRKVAIKRLAGEDSNSLDDNKNVLREARSVARLNHPNIAAVYDVLESGGRVHIVMEYVPGESLAAMIRHGPMPPSQVVGLGRQIADGLAEAHRAGIIHRDLKPANVVINDAGCAKILDFGVARRLPSETSNTSDDAIGESLSARGEETHPRAGTPAYMAPERFAGEPASVRSDIYSLGVLLFECLTGKRPFAGALPNLRQAVLHSPIPSLDTIAPQSPPDLNRVVARALERDPSKRYTDAWELSRDLSEIEGSFSTESTPHGWWRPSPRGSTRSRRLRWGAATAILIAAGLLTWRAKQPPAVRAFAERDWLLIADFENSTSNPIFDKTAREGLELALNQSAYVNVFPRARAIETLGRMKRDTTTPIDAGVATEICRREGIPVLLTGSVRSAGGQHQLRAQVVQAATGKLLFAGAEEFGPQEQLFQKVDALAQTVRRDLGESIASINRSSKPLQQVTTSSLPALELYSKGREAKARGDLATATNLFERAIAADPGFAMAHLYLGQVHLYQGGVVTAAVEETRRAFELRADVTPRERYLIESTYHGAVGEFNAAAASLQALVGLYPDDLDGRYELAQAYSALGRPGPAIEQLRAFLRIDPINADAYSYLGLYLVDAGRTDEAITALRDASARGVDSPLFGWGLGAAYVSQGEFARAEEEFARLGAVRPALAEAFRVRALLHRGRLAEATTRLSSLIRADQYGPMYQLMWHRFRGETRLLSGDVAGARSDMEGILANDDPLTLLKLRWLAARLLLAAGHREPAERFLVQLRADRGRSSFDRYCLKTLAGEIALAKHAAREAIRQFESALQEYPAYEAHIGLARALSATNDLSRSIAEWQAVLADRGSILRIGFPPDWVLARLELARAQRRAGLRDIAKRSYADFFQAWSGADPIPVLRAARSEHAALEEELKGSLVSLTVNQREKKR